MTTRDDGSGPDDENVTDDGGAFNWENTDESETTVNGGTSGDPDEPTQEETTGESDEPTQEETTGESDEPTQEETTGESDSARDAAVDPFAELASDGDDGTLADRFSSDTPDDVFDLMEVDELDEEDVWDALDADGGVGTKTASREASETVDLEASGPMDPEASEHVIDKRTFCQRCPYFAAPPETACTHEETTIVEVIDSEEFRVRNCPMVGKDGPRFNRRS